MSRKYDSTIARVAGNIASGLIERFNPTSPTNLTLLAQTSVELARAIVAEVGRTEPVQVPDPCNRKVYHRQNGIYSCTKELGHTGECS